MELSQLKEELEKYPHLAKGLEEYLDQCVEYLQESMVWQDYSKPEDINITRGELRALDGLRRSLRDE